LSPFRRYLPILTLVLATAGFYLYKLNGVGVLGPDEPRYVAIGRAMAQTGDWITPRLWGSPWFEKPPLLYWMTAAGASLGLDPELSGRLPVALLSLTFLGVMFALLRREFGTTAAAVSVALLATSAAWITYSDLGLTDLPLAVCFSLAVFLAMPLVNAPGGAARVSLRLAAIGVCLGLAMLAKGLVPLALALPGVWFLRRYLKKFWLPMLSCAVVAGPWYIAMYERHGAAFVEELFVKQHFARLYSASLQHVQPWYYYLPVLLGGLFPWTPLLALPLLRREPWDARRRFLLTTVLFGIVLFSVSTNKLPGYLLPLIPALFALVGCVFEHKEISELGRGWLAPCAVLIAAIPLLAQALPGMLESWRITAFQWPALPATTAFYVAVPLAALLLGRRSWVALLLVLCVAGEGIYLKAVAYPALDKYVSARGLWRELQHEETPLCDGGVDRTWLYGLNFYRGEALPECDPSFKLALRSEGGKPALKVLK
jgi:4-amino-4-deoxy-L-arabinose transferase-like glycosyltransferase